MSEDSSPEGLIEVVDEISWLKAQASQITTRVSGINLFYAFFEDFITFLLSLDLYSLHPLVKGTKPARKWLRSLLRALIWSANHN